MALLRFHGLHAGHSGLWIVLLLAGIAFAGLLVWLIERNGRTRVYRAPKSLN
jgi:hypothetical protein